MFEAVQKHTNTTYGASAIKDVTATKSMLVDEMESFWLAETLKYFYLLFSEPTLVSLDDYVLCVNPQTNWTLTKANDFAGIPKRMDSKDLRNGRIAIYFGFVAFHL